MASTISASPSDSRFTLVVNPQLDRTKQISERRRSTISTVITEAPFEMSNLWPKHTGLPFVVWISVRGGARHDVRVKVSAGPKAIPEDMVTVGIRPNVKVLDGALSPDALELLKAWIELNRSTLISYWDGEIDTKDALERLAKIEK